MVDLAFTVAFVGFFAFMARLLLKQMKQAAHSYRLSVSHPLSEAENRLKKAKENLTHMTKERELTLVQCQQILELARQEVQFISHKSQEEIKASHEAYVHLFTQHAKALRAQWTKEMTELIWTSVLEGLHRKSTQCPSRIHFDLIAKKLQRTDLFPEKTGPSDCFSTPASS